MTKRLAEGWLRGVLDQTRRGDGAGDGRDGSVVRGRAAEYLGYVEHDRARKPWTLRGYRSVINAHLWPEVGSMAIEDVTTEAIEAWIAVVGGRSGRETSS